MHLLSVNKIYYSTSEKNNLEILSDISFEVSEATILGIAGESGSGKTTLAHILAGILIPSSGNI